MTDDRDFEDDVAARLHDLKVQREAKRRDAKGDWQLPPVSDEIAEELEKGVPPITYVIDKLAPSGSNVLLVAERKVGKSTLVMNLVAAATRGEDFLGRFPIGLPDQSSITYLNFELDKAQAERWLEDMGVRERSDGPRVRLFVDNWKGYRIPLPNDEVENALVDLLTRRRSSALVIDPYGAMISHDENSNADAREWTNAIDRIARRAGLVLVVIAAHSGSSSVGADDVRVRGAYRLEDWMSVKWSYTHSGDVNEYDQTDTTRYLSAWGRDVNVESFEIAYDGGVHRRLTASASGRSKAQSVAEMYAKKAFDAMTTYVYKQRQKGAPEPIEINAGDLSTEAGVAPTSKKAKAFTSGRNLAIRNGWLTERRDGTAKFYSLGEVRPSDHEKVRRWGPDEKHS